MACDQHSPKRGRQSEVKGKEQKGRFYLGPDSGTRLQKERGEQGPGPFSITSIQSFLVSAGKETQNLALEMKPNIVGRGLPTSFLLHPNSHRSFLDYSRKLWMNHLLVIYLPVPTTVLHLFMSTSKDVLFHATLPPTGCNQHIGANLSEFSLS